MAGPAFNPDQYLSEKAGSAKPTSEAFDPSAYLQEKTGKEPMSGGEAALIKAEEGSQLGLRPVVAGIGSAAGELYHQLADPPVEYARGRGPQQGSPLSQILGAFKEGRQQAIDEQNQAQADHPNISMAANIGGGLLTTPFIAAPKTLLGAAKLGAGLGAARAAGEADSLSDAGMKIGEGTAGGMLGYGAAKGLEAATSKTLSSMAENKAFKAAGAMLKDFRNAYRDDPQKINELGRTMLENGLSQAGDTVKSIAQKSEGLKEETGKQIGKVYENVLDQLTSPESNVAPEAIHEIQMAGYHPEAQAEGLKQALAAKWKGEPGVSAALPKVNSIIDDLSMNGNNVLPERALALKGKIDAMIDWSAKKGDLPIEQEMLKDVRGFIDGRIKGQVEMMDKALGSKQTQELLRLNKLYGNVSEIANVSRDRALREMANQSFGLGDKLGAGIGAMIGGAPGAVAGGTLNHAVKSFGNAALASGLDAASRQVGNAANYAPIMSTTIRKREDLKKRFEPGNGGEIEMGSRGK